MYEPGGGLSITTFYDTVAIAAEAYAYRHGTPPCSVASLAGWVGANVTSAISRYPEHLQPYLTLGGLLNSANEAAWEATSYCTTECTVLDETVAQFPRLEYDRAACPCGKCTGQAERVYCRQSVECVGRSWPDLRHGYETWMSSERFDLLLWDNVTILHGANGGTRDRVLRPLALSLPKAADEPYERWLADAWERRFSSLATATGCEPSAARCGAGQASKNQVRANESNSATRFDYRSKSSSAGVLELVVH